MRILVNGGRVQMNNGRCIPHYGVSSSKDKDLSKKAEEKEEEKREIVGGSLDNFELARRLNSLNIKKPTAELKSRLMDLNPKKNLINFTI